MKTVRAQSNSGRDQPDHRSEAKLLGNTRCNDKYGQQNNKRDEKGVNTHGSKLTL